MAATAQYVEAPQPVCFMPSVGSCLLYYSGGIRGIVELEVLRVIEGQLKGIPISAFFDLIVGTRYV